MKEHNLWTVVGGAVVISATIWCLLALTEPWVHTHPKIVADLGQISVLCADRRRPFLLRASRTLAQFDRASSMCHLHSTSHWQAWLSPFPG